MDRNLNILVVGAGLGGLTAALALQRAGFQVTVCEQARELRELGAGILVTPNAMRGLHWLGVGPALVARSTRLGTTAWRHHQTGEVLKTRPPSSHYEQKYGTEFLQVHRNDLHSLLCEAVQANQPGAIRTDHRFVSLAQDADGVDVRFANGATLRADAVIGADGCSSRVRSCLQGEEDARYSGQVAYRALVPTELVPPEAIDTQLGLYIGPMRILLHYDLRQGAVRNVIALAREPRWQEEGWAIPGSRAEFLELYHDFHPNVAKIINALPEGSLFKWGLRDREPMRQWTWGRVTMLGDAAHPISPFLGQGACMAIEDGVVLARCCAAAATLDEAFERYENTRKEHANGVQIYSRMQADAYQGITREGVNLGRDAEALGLYDYDPVTVPI